MTINGAGAQSQSQLGSLISLSLFAFASNDVRNMSYRIIEDAAAGAGYNGARVMCAPRSRRPRPPARSGASATAASP
jgi:hypothetical protein